MPKRSDSLIREKPMRGREMKTTVVPSEMFDTMKLVSAKKTLRGESLAPELERPKDNKAHLYHEGYVDGKLYMVPDENLQQMKADVHTILKTQGMQGLTGVEKDSFKLDHYDNANRKLSRFLSKANLFESDSEETESSEEDEEEEEEEIGKKGKGEKGKEAQREDKEDHGKEGEKSEEVREMHEEEKIMEEDEREMDKEKEKYANIQEERDAEEEKYEKEGEQIKEKIVEEEQTMDTDDKERFPQEEMIEQDSLPQEQPFGLPQKPITQPEPKPPQSAPVQDRLRLLISGHFRKDQKPIYIVQQYSEEQDLFKDQKVDFQSKRKLSENGIDAVISGRFYNENILEESGGRPVALNIKPHKILIDENRSNVHDDYFEQIYNFESVDISLTGEFLKSDITKRITPFLSLGVKSRGSPEKNTNNRNKNGEKKQSSTTVFTCKLKPTVPFSENV